MDTEHSLVHASQSESCGVVSSEPFSVGGAIVTHNTDHLVHVGAHLDAAGQSHEGGVALVARGESSLLCEGLLVKFLEPGVGHMHGALTTADTGRVEVNWVLMGSHLVLLITTLAVSPNSWQFVSREDFKKAFTSVGSHSSGDSVMGHSVDPDDLVGDLDATIGLRGA